MNSYTKKIFLVGAIYALDEILIFIRAMEIFRNRTNINVGFFIVGPEIGSAGYDQIMKENLERGGFVHFIERVDPDTADLILSISDLNFLPYPFNFSNLVRESFPSKYARYLGAKKPILIFGPAESSLIQTLSSNGLTTGIVSTHSKTNILNELEKLLLNDSYIELHLRELDIISDKLYSKANFINSLKNAFKVDVDFVDECVVLSMSKISLSKSWVSKVNTLGRDYWHFRNSIPTKVSKIPLMRCSALFVKRILGDSRYMRFRKQLFK